MDLSDRDILSPHDLWSALAVACEFPDWFAGKLESSVDALRGAIAPGIDRGGEIRIRLRPVGLFAPGSEWGRSFVEACTESGVARVDLVN